MVRRVLIVLSVVSLVSLSVAAASAATYVFTTLNPAGSDTSDCGIAVALVGGVPSAAGATGAGGTASLRQGNPVVWNTAGIGTNLLTYIPGSPTKGMVQAIDSPGDVVGNARVGTAGNVQSAWFLPAGSTSATLLPTLNSGDSWVVAYGVRNSSQVVGVDGPSGTTGQAVLWTQSGGTWSIAALPSLTASLSSQANAITNNGIVAGFSSVTIGSSTYQDPTTWTYDGSAWTAHDMLNRNAFPTGSAAALAVNSSGDCVGYVNYTPVEFRHDGTTIVLAAPSSQTNSDQADGINDSGVIVGSSNGTAFIYDAVNGFRDMNAAFAGVIPAGWTLSDATGIDNNGDIVGYMTNGSVSRGFLLMANRLPGDANLDGTVDILDLNRLLTNFDKSGMTWSQGDFDGNGVVDIVNLNKILTNFDKTAASPAAVAAVPEPSAPLLIATVVVGLLASAWRKRKHVK